MLTNFHTHTVFCDGKNTPEEMVLSAIEKGFTALGFSGHGLTGFDPGYCLRDIAGYRAEVLRLLEVRPALAAIDAIALFEGGLAELCDITVAVTAPVEDRVRRLMARDRIPEDYARSRIAAQHEEAWFRQRCDCILENNGTQIQFHEKCVAFLENSYIMEK